MSINLCNIFSPHLDTPQKQILPTLMQVKCRFYPADLGKTFFTRVKEESCGVERSQRQKVCGPRIQSPVSFLNRRCRVGDVSYLLLKHTCSSSNRADKSRASSSQPWIDFCVREETGKNGTQTRTGNNFGEWKFKKIKNKIIRRSIRLFIVRRWYVHPVLPHLRSYEAHWPIYDFMIKKKEDLDNK